MKIIESIFGKERKELEKFNQLDLDERSIVFYSESSVLLYPYAEKIIKELEKRDQKICYLTSSKDDPIFKNKIKKIRDDTVFNIGKSGEVAASEIIQIINKEKYDQNSLW